MTMNETTLELPDPTQITDPAAVVEHWHHVVLRCGQGVLDAARHAGDALIAQREVCRQERQRFKDWCRDQLSVSHRTATGYMGIARHWAKLEEVQRASPERPLSIREALKCLRQDTLKVAGEERTTIEIEERNIRRAVLRKGAPQLQSGQDLDAGPLFYAPDSWPLPIRNQAKDWLARKSKEILTLWHRQQLPGEPAAAISFALTQLVLQIENAGKPTKVAPAEEAVAGSAA